MCECVCVCQLQGGRLSPRELVRDGRMQVAVAQEADLRGGVEPDTHRPRGRLAHHGGEGGREALPARVLDGQ
jgi:hypothetical protein